MSIEDETLQTWRDEAKVNDWSRLTQHANNANRLIACIDEIRRLRKMMNMKVRLNLHSARGEEETS